MRGKDRREGKTGAGDDSHHPRRSALAAPSKPTPQSLQAKAPAAEGLTFADVAKLPRPGSQGVAMAKFSPVW